MHRTFPGGLSYPKFLRTPWRLKCMLWGISYPEMLQSTPMYQISHVQQSPGPLSTRSETVSQELSLGNHLFRIGRRSDCLDPPNDDRHTDMMMYVPSCPSMWVHDVEMKCCVLCSLLPISHGWRQLESQIEKCIKRFKTDYKIQLKKSGTGWDGWTSSWELKVARRRKSSQAGTLWEHSTETFQMYVSDISNLGKLH